MYEYMHSLEKMNEEHLPPKEAFFSSLTNWNIPKSDYPHAKPLWNTFNVSKMRGYHELYMVSMFSVFCAFLNLYRSLYL